MAAPVSRQAEHQWLSQGPPPGTLAVVSLSSLLDASGQEAEKAARALLHEGAFLLELPRQEASSLAKTLDASGALFAEGPVTQLEGNKALVEYCRGDASALPAALRDIAAAAHARLDAAGRAVLRALSGVSYDARDVAYPQAVPIVDLEALLEPPSRPTPSPSALTFLHYGHGAAAAPHTDRGLLTLAYALQAGLEVALPGAAPGAWLAPPVEAHTVVVLAGECLAVATGNAVRPCLHRVVAGAPRRSLVLRLRADPAAALPLTFGPYWRCLTVAAFNDRFAALHSSVNQPWRTPAASLAEQVLALPSLAGAIVAHLGDDARALARVELVCAALRDAVGPHWRRLCIAVSVAGGPNGSPGLPRRIVATDARQWRTLHRCLAAKSTGQATAALPAAVPATVPRLAASFHPQIPPKPSLMCLGVEDDDSKIFFKVLPTVRFAAIFRTYCSKKGLDQGDVKFLFDGERIRPEQTPADLQMEDGDSIDAMVRT